MPGWLKSLEKGLAVQRDLGELGSRYGRFTSALFNKNYKILSKDPVWKSILDESPQYMDEIMEFEKSGRTDKEQFVEELINKSNSYARTMSYNSELGRVPTAEDAGYFRGMQLPNNMYNQHVRRPDYDYRTIHLKTFADPRYGDNVYYFLGKPQVDYSSPLELWWSQRKPKDVDMTRGWIGSGKKGEKNIFLDKLNKIWTHNLLNGINSGLRDPYTPFKEAAIGIPYNFMTPPEHLILFGEPEQKLQNFEIGFGVKPINWMSGKGYKKGGKLIPKGQEGLGKWFLRQLRRLVPAITGTVKETEKVAKKSEAAANLQKGVQRAQKISKSQQFKELVNSLELDDRVSSELISRYKALDPTTQSTERKMLLRLMKNNQIHSIADFDLVVDKVHSNKMGGNPNILGIETISDLDTPFAESWNRKQKEKQEYDRALGTFTKMYDYPKINYTAYVVPATRQGQQDLLTVMKGQYNKKIQPWCVIETDKKTGELTPAAIERWDKEYAGPKFALMDKKGKIRYFMSGNSGWFDMNDRLAETIREPKPTLQIGNGLGYRMFKLPELHSYKTVNPDKRHFYLNWKTPLSANISKDLSGGTRIGKTPSGYTIHHKGPHDPKTSVFLYEDSNPSVRHYESGPIPGLIGNWYKTQSGKSRFMLDSFIPHAYTILDESGNVLKDKNKNNSLLFHNNMMLMQNGKDARLFRGKDQESLLKFALNGEDLDTGYAETLFGVTPLYEQFGTRHGINPWDLSGSGKEATDLPSALNKFGFQLPELKKGGTIIEEKN